MSAESNAGPKENPLNILVLNGAPAAGPGAAGRAASETAAAEALARGWTTAVFDLDGLDIGPCRGCFACWLKHPGLCAIEDDQGNILKAMASADILVWTTPVVFGGYGAALKKSLDRFIPNILPFFIRVQGEIHHPPRYPRRRSLLVFGTLPGPDPEAERIFHALVQRNALNLGSVISASRVLPENTPADAWAATISGLLSEAGEAL